MTRSWLPLLALVLLGCKREDTRVCPDPVAAASSTTTAAAPVKTIDIPLPKAIAFGDQVTVMVVAIDATGRTSVDGLAITDDKAITESAAKALGRDPEVKVVIMADASITYGRVIAVVDRVRTGGIAKLAFAMPMPMPAPSP